MSLRDRMNLPRGADPGSLYDRFGVTENPFPTSSQNTGNPHYELPSDAEAENLLAQFLQNGRSQVLVVVGTQGVGKTNFLNHLETQLLDIRDDYKAQLVVRYLADPEPSFDGIIRAILQEIGPDHLSRLGAYVAGNKSVLDVVRSLDLRSAIRAVAAAPDDASVQQHAMQWLLGFRLVNATRDALGVSFRLDTVESRTSVLRDYVNVSIEAGLLKGVVLLLDELEKQAGVMGPTAVVRYLSAMRAIIDALPRGLTMVIAITPDALRRYSSALPAFRSRLENQIDLLPLTNFEGASHLARFYESDAKRKAMETKGGKPGKATIVTDAELRSVYEKAETESKRVGADGVRQRDFLNRVHKLAEEKFRASS